MLFRSSAQGEALSVAAFAVVCHPHPLFGGTLDNKVVYTVARAFEQLGASAIRFNFRGVGASAGSARTSPAKPHVSRTSRSGDNRCPCA